MILIENKRNFLIAYAFQEIVLNINKLVSNLKSLKKKFKTVMQTP